MNEETKSSVGVYPYSVAVPVDIRHGHVNLKPENYEYHYLDMVEVYRRRLHFRSIDIQSQKWVTFSL